MTTTAIAASAALALGVWRAVAVMSMATRRPSATEILGTEDLRGLGRV